MVMVKRQPGPTSAKNAETYLQSAGRRFDPGGGSMFPKALSDSPATQTRKHTHLTGSLHCHAAAWRCRETRSQKRPPLPAPPRDGAPTNCFDPPKSGSDPTARLMGWPGHFNAEVAHPLRPPRFSLAAKS